MLVNHYGCDYPLHGIFSVADALRYTELLKLKISDNPTLEQNVQKFREVEHGADFDNFEL